MIKYSKEEMFNEFEKNKNLVLYVGYFKTIRNSYGAGRSVEYLKDGNTCMRLKYDVAKSINLEDNSTFYKVKDGFATEYIYNQFFNEQ